MGSQHHSLPVWALQQAEKLLYLLDPKLCVLGCTRPLVVGWVESQEPLCPRACTTTTNLSCRGLAWLLLVLLNKPLLKTSPQGICELVIPTRRCCLALRWDLLRILIGNLLRWGTSSTRCHAAQANKSTHKQAVRLVKQTRLRGQLGTRGQSTWTRKIGYPAQPFIFYTSSL